MNFSRFLFRLLVVCCALFGVPPAVFATVVTDNRETTATMEEFRSWWGYDVPYVRLELRYPGVYRVYGHELTSAGVSLKDIQPQKLGIYHEGQLMPVNVETSSPGAFRDSDYFEFIGDHPRGTHVTFKPHNTFNVYFVTWNEPRPLQYRQTQLAASSNFDVDATFMEQRHNERDLYLFRSLLSPDVTDHFFWGSYAAGSDDRGWLLDFPGFDSRLKTPVKLTVRVFGQTRVPNLRPTHRFALNYNDHDLGMLAFDGLGYHDFHTSVPAGIIGQQKRVRFTTPEDRKDVVDSIALDWISTRYPRRLDAAGSERFTFNNDLISSKSGGLVQVRGLPANSRIFSPGENLIYLQDSGTTAVYMAMRDMPTSYTAVADVGLYHVDSVKYKPASRKVAPLASDFEALVVYHPAIDEAAKVYAEYRNSTGLKTVAVDALDVFDAVSNGFLDDYALKRYIRFAREQSPSFRYLVLIGDAVADYRETNYAELRGEGTEDIPRNLVPIHWVYNPATTHSAGYPDDNWYGSFAWVNSPDVAVGRIPANNNKEGFAYLSKLLEYEQNGLSKGDKLVMISSVEKSFQELVKQTQKEIGDYFSSSTLLFPETTHAPEEVLRLREQFEAGTQLMYYVGHGGSFVWRVGPVDFKQQKDLFTPADVEKLTNKGRYPIITCSSCYTTSFDNTLSLGEALVLSPERGAIALIGTPWKSTVHEDHRFNTILLKSYVDPKITRLGDAFLAAKTATRPQNPTQIDFQTFTLLGDPCLNIPNKTTRGSSAVWTNDSMESKHDSNSHGREVHSIEAEELFEKPAHVYRRRLILEQTPQLSKEFVVPAEAKQIVLSVRGAASSDIFPRIRLSLIETETSRTVLLGERNVQSQTLYNIGLAVPPEFAGRNCRLKIELLNYHMIDDRNVVYLARVFFVE